MFSRTSARKGLSLLSSRTATRSTSASLSTSTAVAHWDEVPMGPPDAILGITVAFNNDENENKINLGVGAYRDDDGNPFVLNAIRKAEEIVYNKAEYIEYAPITGNPTFLKKAAELAFHESNNALNEGRIASCQSLSGTGALRLGGAFLQRFASSNSIYLPNPTWGNHIPIFKDSGLEVKKYRYYNPDTISLDMEGMMEDIKEAPKESTFLFHACAHNPTGVDPTIEQWEEVSAVCKERNHTIFVDSAYQGFASGDTEQDAQALRQFVNDGHNILLAQSFAKNMGLYGQRCGAFHIVTSSKDVKAAVDSQVKIIVRPMYSSPPLHPARVAAEVLSNPELHDEWLVELKGMADRIIGARQQLTDKLVDTYKSSRNWDHINNQIGTIIHTSKCLHSPF
eukprot:TRINITY_DN425_c0_g1_i6.p1 TRINITY_DN425_c0_g1~~TRINITY_DN425_c0_g1_i6.p1  ORF type:complete len:404 (+),score=131.01 TRINITY_DN425_c0_g1_i6:25-1212(+)